MTDHNTEMIKLLDEFFSTRIRGNPSGERHNPTYGELSLFFMKEISLSVFTNQPVKWTSKERDEFCEKHRMTMFTFYYMLRRLVDIGIVKKLGNSRYSINEVWGAESQLKLLKFILDCRK